MGDSTNKNEIGGYEVRQPGRPDVDIEMLRPKKNQEKKDEEE